MKDSVVIILWKQSGGSNNFEDRLLLETHGIAYFLLGLLLLLL